jgi:hypothetical protein
MSTAEGTEVIAVAEKGEVIAASDVTKLQKLQKSQQAK